MQYILLFAGHLQIHHSHIRWLWSLWLPFPRLFGGKWIFARRGMFYLFKSYSTISPYYIIKPFHTFGKSGLDKNGTWWLWMLWLHHVATWWFLGFWHRAVHMEVHLDLTSKMQLRNFQITYLRRAILWESLIYQNESVHSFIKLLSLVWLGLWLALFKVVCQKSCLQEKKGGGFIIVFKVI